MTRNNSAVLGLAFPLVLGSLLANPLRADDSLATPADIPVDPVAESAADSLPASAAKRHPTWLVIPGLFNFPETGPGGALMVRVRNVAGVPGYVSSTLAVTMKRQAELSLGWLRDSIGEVWRTKQSVAIGRFPDVWYGVGNPTEDSMKSRYTPMYVEGESRLARYVGGRWAIEGILGFDVRTIRREDEGVFRTVEPLAGDGGTHFRSGIAVEYEGRDLPENPRSGPYLRLEASASLPGSDHLWNGLELDGSQAVSAGSWIGVVRVRSLDAWGDVPFWELPYLGDRLSLRGLPERRLRGDAVQCAGAEVRYAFPRMLGMWTQAAVFAEEGRAGSHDGVWTAEPTPAGGAGVRLLLDGGRAVLRIDYGASPVGSGLYIDFGQAF